MKKLIPIVAGVGTFAICRIATSAAGGVSVRVLAVKTAVALALFVVVVIIAVKGRLINGRDDKA